VWEYRVRGLLLPPSTESEVGFQRAEWSGRAKWDVEKAQWEAERADMRSEMAREVDVQRAQLGEFVLRGG
jgi:hypothetical protein